MRHIIFALLGMTASPALAGTPLWQNVEEGMTVQQVQALYPNGQLHRGGVFHGGHLDIPDYRPIPDCPSTVHVYFEDGGAEAVVVNGRGSILGLCADQVRQALLARYGQPVEDNSGSAANYIWIHDGVVMRYREPDRSGMSSSSWTVE